MSKLHEWSQKSSIHCVKYIFASENLKLTKLFWFLSLILSLCGLFYYVYWAYYKLEIHPETAIRTMERLAYNFPAPAITICSPLLARDNKVNFLNAIKQYTFESKFKLTEENCKYFSANLHWCKPDYLFLAKKYCDEKFIKNFNVLKYINKSALKIDEIFHFCDSQCQNEYLRIFTDDGICFNYNLQDFNTIFNDVIHDDFKCYQRENFNKTDIQWTAEKGYQNNNSTFPARAYRKIFHKATPFLKPIDHDNVCLFKAFRIFIHSPNEIATPFHESFFLNYEEATYLLITPKLYRFDDTFRKFSPEIRKCYFDGEKKLHFFKTYTKAHCEWECFANKTLDKCGCVKFSMPREKKTRICDLTELACVPYNKILDCNCYSPCVEIKYDFKMKRTIFNRKLMDTEQTENSSMARVWFAIVVDFVEETENYISYTIQNFIADFGGLLGLFLGSSLLSIVEILYALIENFSWLKLFRRKGSILQPTAIVTNKEILTAINTLSISIYELKDQVATIDMRVGKIERKNASISVINLDE